MCQVSLAARDGNPGANRGNQSGNSLVSLTGSPEVMQAPALADSA